MDPVDLLQRRIENLVAQRRLTRREAERFLELDGQMRAEDRRAMKAFHLGKEYRVILERVLAGLVAVGEPGAAEKQDRLLAEIGTMGPGVFLTPWEMTIHHLDQRVGSLREVEEFYFEAIKS